MSERLFNLFMDVFNAANQRDRNAFGLALRLFNGWYRKASCEEQGAYHHKVAEFMKLESPSHAE